MASSQGISVAEPLAARRNQIPRGIAYMVASTVMFAGVNAIVKWELQTYPIGEVAFFRSLFAFLAVATMILPRTGIAVLRTRRYREHLQRGLSQFGSMTCMFVAFRALSLGSAIAISFSAPLFTTLLSILILKERVGVHRWSALIVGFVGVLIITHPGAGMLTYGALFAVGNADRGGAGGPTAPHRLAPQDVEPGGDDDHRAGQQFRSWQVAPDRKAEDRRPDQ